MSIIFVTQKSPQFGLGHYVRSNLVKKKIKLKSYYILNNTLIYKKKKFFLDKTTDKKIINFFKEKAVKIIYFDIHMLSDLHKKIFYIAKKEKIKVIFYDFYDPIVKKAYLAFFTPSYYVINKKYTPKRVFVGWQYVLLNKNKKNSKSIKKFDILLSFGGSDPNRITEFFLKLILKIKLNIKICCLIGNLNTRKTQIKKLCVRSNGMIKYFEPKKTIDKYILQSKFAIVTIGLTSYETIFFRTPSLFIPIKKIDIQVGQYFEKLKLGISSQYFKNFKSDVLKKKIKSLLTKKRLYLNKQIIDGKGLQRVINILLKEHENS